MKEWKIAILILLALAVVGNVAKCGVREVQRQVPTEVLSE